MKNLFGEEEKQEEWKETPRYTRADELFISSEPTSIAEDVTAEERTIFIDDFCRQSWIIDRAMQATANGKKVIFLTTEL